MSWFLKHPHEERTLGTSDSESGSQLETISNSTLDDTSSDSSVDENGNM
jgi:plastin-1